MKNKILDNLFSIFVVLVFLFGMTLTWNHAKSENHLFLQFMRICGLTSGGLICCKCFVVKKMWIG